MIDPEFMTIVRGHLKYLDPEAGLSPTEELRALGLDSMEAVSLMIEIEDEFGVVLPDSALTAETFQTPESLWAAVDRAIC